MKTELARIVGQLSCIQSGLSQLSDTRAEFSRPPEILCHQISLAAEHAGNTSPSLKANIVKPFLPLLRKQAPSSVKQGTFLFVVCLPFSSIIILQKALKNTHSYFAFSAFLEALPHLCRHVNLVGEDSDSRAVLCALIGLMEDSDPVVRTRFSQSVRFLLTETTRNSEQGSLSEVRNASELTQNYKLHSFCITVEIHI